MESYFSKRGVYKDAAFPEVYLKPSQTSIELLLVNYFCKSSTFQMFDWVHNLVFVKHLQWLLPLSVLTLTRL